MRVIALIVRAGAVVVAAGFLFSLVSTGPRRRYRPRGTAVTAAPTPRRSRPELLPSRRSRPAS